METLKDTIQNIKDIKEVLQSKNISTNEDIHLAIIQRLGYRKMKDKLWGKPFGTGLITIEFDQELENECLMTSWFINLKDEVSVWSSKKLEKEIQHFQYRVCEFEGRDTNPPVCNNFNNDFGFFTREEQFSRML